MSEEVGVPDFQRVSWPGSPGIVCGIYARFASHRLIPKNSERLRGQKANGTDEKRSRLDVQGSRPECVF